MSSPSKSLLALALVAASACGPRQVEVRTAPPTTTTAQGNAVQLTNNLSQAINVYGIVRRG